MLFSDTCSERFTSSSLIFDLLLFSDFKDYSLLDFGFWNEYLSVDFFFWFFSF